MTPPDTLITFIVPADLEAILIDELLDHPELAPGFSSHPVEGHGQEATFVSTSEHVRGRARHVRLEVLLHRSGADHLIAHLLEKFSRANVFWWMSPVVGSGRMA